MNRKIREAIDTLLARSSFFALELARLEVSESQEVDTMRVSTKRLEYNRERVESLPVGDVAFMLAHEVMHVVGKHSIRQRCIPEADHNMFNVAADLAINSTLRNVMPTPMEFKPLYPEGEKWDMPPDKDAEWYYQELLRKEREEQKKQQEQEQGENDDEQEQGQEESEEMEEGDEEVGDDREELGEGEEDGEETGEGGEGEDSDESGDEETEQSGKDATSGRGDKDSHRGDSSADEEEADGNDDEDESVGRGAGGNQETDKESSIRKAAREAMQEGREDIEPHDEETDGDAAKAEQEIDMAVAIDLEQCQNIGKGMPEALKAALGLAIAPKTIPWQRALRMYLNAREWRKYRYTRPNRRQFRTDVVLPSRGNRTIGNICIVADTSGSMMYYLPQVVKEIASLTESFPNSVITLIEVDTDVRNIRKLGRGYPPVDWEHFEWSGLGGTEIAPGVEAAMKLPLPPTFMIIATDYYLGSIPPDPKVPVIWLLTSAHGNPPYGNVIRMS